MSKTINEKIKDLDEIIYDIETKSIDVEDMVKKYKQAIDLSKDIENSLEEQRNEIQEIKDFTK